MVPGREAANAVPLTFGSSRVDAVAMRDATLQPRETAPVPGGGAAGPVASSTTAAATTPAAASMSPEQLQALSAARQEARRITRAANVAAFSGWSLAVFAILTALSGIFSIPALLLGLGLGGTAVVELRGSRGLRTFDPLASRRLGINQLVLAGMIAVYASWGIVQAFAGPSPYETHIAAGGQVGETLASIDRLHRTIMVAFYVAVIGLGLVFTGGASIYYFTRGHHVMRYLHATPPWIVEALRACR